MATINKKDRFRLFQEIKQLEFKVGMLASIVQNEFDINSDDINNWLIEKNHCKNRLEEIAEELISLC